MHGVIRVKVTAVHFGARIIWQYWSTTL